MLQYTPVAAMAAPWLALSLAVACADERLHRAFHNNAFRPRFQFPCRATSGRQCRHNGLWLPARLELVRDQRLCQSWLGRGQRSGAWPATDGRPASLQRRPNQNQRPPNCCL